MLPWGQNKSLCSVTHLSDAIKLESVLYFCECSIFLRALKEELCDGRLIGRRLLGDVSLTIGQLRTAPRWVSMSQVTTKAGKKSAQRAQSVDCK